MQVRYEKSLFSTSVSLHRQLQLSGVINTVPLDRGKLIGDTRRIAGSSKRRRLLKAGDDDEVFMIRSLNVTPKTTEQHLIVPVGKSEAEVTNNRRVLSRYCTIGVTDRHEASRGLSATAELLVFLMSVRGLVCIKVTSCYWSSIAMVAVSCIVSEMKRDIGRYIITIFHNSST